MAKFGVLRGNLQIQVRSLLNEVLTHRTTVLGRDGKLVICGVFKARGLNVFLGSSIKSSSKCPFYFTRLQNTKLHSLLFGISVWYFGSLVRLVKLTNLVM